MNAVYIIFIVIVALIPFGLIYYLSERNKQLQNEVETLQRLQNTGSLNAKKVLPAFEFLRQVGKKNQFEVTEHERTEDWIECSFQYQNGNFTCWCGVNNDELILRMFNIQELPYTNNNYKRVCALCYQYTTDFRYTKVSHTYDEEKNALFIDVGVDSICQSEKAFMYYIFLCFNMSNKVREELKEIIVPESLSMNNNNQIPN